MLPDLDSLFLFFFSMSDYHTNVLKSLCFVWYTVLYFFGSFNKPPLPSLTSSAVDTLTGTNLLIKQ